jgi:long-chain acyl-CoA synthetase
MNLKNLAAILDPGAPDDRPLIIEVSPEGDERLRLSYGDGRRRIAAVARGLLKRGLKHGEAVAIVAANSADYLVLYMATMAAGWSRCASTTSCRARPWRTS